MRMLVLLLMLKLAAVLLLFSFLCLLRNNAADTSHWEIFGFEAECWFVNSGGQHSNSKNVNVNYAVGIPCLSAGGSAGEAATAIGPMWLHSQQQRMLPPLT